MTVIVAIDPGPVQSAWLRFATHPLTGDRVESFAIWPNDELLRGLRGDLHLMRGVDIVVIEKIEAFGMAVGAEVFETVYVSGQMAEAARPLTVDRLGRKAVKIHLCGSMRAKDPNIRQSLIDRFGGPDAIGKKAKPGPLYGVAGDVWSALAVACTWSDLHG